MYAQAAVYETETSRPLTARGDECGGLGKLGYNYSLNYYCLDISRPGSRQNR